jgi:DNA uptake protein ComE-like DNA-binding protein
MELRRMRHAHQFRLVVVVLVLACSAALAQSRRTDEPPLVGTVMFRPSRSGDKLDINRASKRQLSSLPGIVMYADKIIAGRPYNTKLDLVKRGIVPLSVYDKVKGRIIAHHPRATKPNTTRSATPSSSRK